MARKPGIMMKNIISMPSMFAWATPHPLLVQNWIESEFNEKTKPVTTAMITAKARFALRSLSVRSADKSEPPCPPPPILMSATATMMKTPPAKS